MNGVVLVLNQNYEPLNVCNIPRAFRLVFGSKAEVIEYDHAEIRTVRQVYRAPSVIRLQHQIRRPRPRVQAHPARDLQPRPAYLPVLRPAGERPHPRPRAPAPPRRRSHVGEPRRRLQAVQPPQGRADPEEAHAPLVRRAVRAAQRHLLPVHAVPRGRERTLEDVPLPRPELRPARVRPGRRGRAPPRGRSSGARRRGRSTGSATTATRPTSSADPCVTPSSIAVPPTGTWPPTRVPTGCVELFPGCGVREPLRHGGRAT